LEREREKKERKKETERDFICLKQAAQGRTRGNWTLFLCEKKDEKKVLQCYFLTGQCTQISRRGKVTKIIIVFAKKGENLIEGRNVNQKCNHLDSFFINNKCIKFGHVRPTVKFFVTYYWRKNKNELNSSKMFNLLSYVDTVS
jgi:hypothetical protein